MCYDQGPTSYAFLAHHDDIGNTPLSYPKSFKKQVKSSKKHPRFLEILNTPLTLAWQCWA